MPNKILFNPIRSTEDKISKISITNGNLLFAVDSGKIYLDTSDERLVMGGAGSAIFYIGDSNVIDTGFNGIFNLHFSALEEPSTVLKEGDILINTDNCFYRIVDLDVDEDLISATRIAIAGSGGGSGSGDGPSGTSGTASVAYVDNKELNVLLGKACPINFIVVAQDSAGEDTIGGSVSWKLDGKVIATQSVSVGQNSFDVGPYLKNLTSAQVLQGTFSLDVGTGSNTTVVKAWKITAVDVSLAWDYNSSIIANQNTLPLNWNVTGGATVSKTTYIEIDDSYQVTKPVISTGAQSITLTRATYGLEHGKHTVSIYVSFIVGDETFTTEKITHEVICVDRENDTPIIALGAYKQTVSQYDTLMIPIYFYNTRKATLSVNGIEQEVWDDIVNDSSVATLRYWSYTPTEAGVQQLNITAGSVEYPINITVEPLKLTVSETEGYAFKIKASEFSSNNALRNWTFTSPENEVVNLTFSPNFDWVNGGLQQETDENGNLRSMITVKAGTRMIIHYPLFKTYNRQMGKNIKIIFKVNNCGKYDADIIQSSAIVNSATGNKIGLEMNAQSATFMSNLNTITTQYCEETYTEYELDIAAATSSKPYIMPWLAGVPAGLTVFSEGDGFKQLDSNLSDITIGSDDCDVNLYLFKVYEKHLSDEEHLENFIMDALNAQEIMERYNRNDVLNENGNGEIDWRRVVEKNPNCWVHLYEIPRICKNKKDEIGKKYLSDGTGETAEYYGLYRDGNSTVPVIQAGKSVGKPFSFKVQGTSSEKYVISAANLDTNFKKGFVDGELNEVSKFQLDASVPGEKYFNTKVNVASCEGANNALNAAWYNDHQPYTSLAKKKNPKKRDTMLFKPGIVFIQDNNPVYEITNTSTQTNLDLNIFKGDDVYKNNPFFKQYAICNFGNSKKNKDTLHDVENPYEICIEVTDNQNIGQHMCAVMGRKSVQKVNEKGETTTVLESVDLTKETIVYDEATHTGNDVYDYFYNTMNDNDYDVRYTSQMLDPEDPGNDGVSNCAPAQIIGWFNLIKWFALNDPSEKNDSHPYGYTGEEFTADTEIFKFNPTSQVFEITHPTLNPETGKYEITYPAYTFKAKDWKGDSTKLGGFEVKTFAKTYTADTQEYRLAKLLNECEDHLIMDSIIYHYLFIERHLMVDNVAKNTFWTSEDENNQYWCVIKDYDNDTADGIDNSGKLSFTYGIEPTDVQSSGISYFNAPDSVWFNFVHKLDEVRMKLYQDLRPTGVWSSQAYLEAFTNWQRTIPERCWIEDYYRKYIRPYEIFQDNGYLAMLEGGQKTLQRKQFETYQEVYMDTKYQAATTSYIDVRANASNVRDISIPVTMYSDCYIHHSWSQNIIHQRAKRGETYYITCPEAISDLTDSTVYWYAPQTYSSIGDLGRLYPKSVKMGESKRLQSLSITGEGQDLLSYTTSELGIKQAILLKHLILKDLTQLNKASDAESPRGIELDLTSLTSLQDFDGTNSFFTSVLLPAGAPLTSVKVEAPTAIAAKDLNFLSTFQVNNFDGLNSIRLDNIDNHEVSSLHDLLLPATSLSTLCLQNVKWTLDDASHINDTAHTIDFLDNLLNEKFYVNYNNDSISAADAVTGVLRITPNAYSGDASLEIYNTYAAPDKFPNLDLVFEDPDCALYEVKILDGNEQEVWRKKFKKNATVNEAFLSTGANGDFLTMVDKVVTSKQNTTQSTFVFANSWTVTHANGSKTVVTVDPKVSLLPLIENVTEDIIIEPNFNSNIRRYTITYYNEDGSLVYYTDTFDYGVKVSSITIPVMPYKDDSDLDLLHRYTPIGWSLYQNGDILSTYDKLIVQNDYNFYAVFRKESVTDSVSPEEYFSWSETTYLSADGKRYSGWCVEPAKIDGNAIELVGKITLATTYQNQPVVGIQGFTEQKNLIGVYWKGEPHLKYISTLDEAAPQTDKRLGFNECENLQYFDMPSTVEIIAKYAFRNCRALQNIVLPEKLRRISTGAFNGAGQFKTITIPSSVTFIGDSSFAYNKIEDIILGASGESFNSDMTIGDMIFAKNLGESINSLVYYNKTLEEKWIYNKNKRIFGEHIDPSDVTISYLG